MNGVYLIVDDMSTRHNLVKQRVTPKPDMFLDVYNYADAITALLKWGNITHVFLDYDLSLLGPTGLDVARFMINRRIIIPVTVISTNPPGSEAIIAELSKAGFNVSREPLLL